MSSFALSLVRFAGLASVSTLFLAVLFAPAASSVSEDDDPCSSPAVKLRSIKPFEVVAEESFYICHPTLSNGYVQCVVGRPAERRSGRIDTTEVVDEHERVCPRGLYFNSVMRACVVAPISDCAMAFAVHPPSEGQLVCESFRMTLPLAPRSVADLICHDKEKHLFIVCPANLAAAFVMQCANGTFFNQFLGRCVEKEADSDCPIDWREMEIENTLKAGQMKSSAVVSPKSACVCKALLAQKPEEEVVYAADPEVDEKFVICVREGAVVHSGECPTDLFWDDDVIACNAKSVRKPVAGCTASSAPAVAKPKPAVVLPGGGTSEDCVECEGPRGVTERQQCECRAALASSGDEVIYMCDPESPDNFLVCTNNGPVNCQPCQTGMKWNDDHQACGPVRKCAAFRCPSAEAPAAAPPKAPAQTAAPTPAPTPVPTASQYCEFFYELHPEKLNWYSAKRICEVNYGTLLTIPDLPTQNHLRSRFGSTSKDARVWIGATDSSRNGNWQWVTGEPFGFTNWYPTQPSGKNENCLQFNYKEAGAWSDEDCALNKPFICQQYICS